MKEWTQVEEDKRGAGGTSPREGAVWVDMAGPEGWRMAGRVEKAEKMEGWRQEKRQTACQVILSEGLCGCEGKKRVKVRDGNNIRRICLYLVSASGCLQKQASGDQELTHSK